MPFLKTQQTPRSKILEETTKKNGFRRTVFSPSGQKKYIGEWKQNLHSGKGIERRNNFVYEGDWQNGMKHGYGILSIEDENGVRRLLYEGEWQFNKKQGEGTQHLPNNELYSGNFLNGLRHGFGEMWYADGGFYIGNWTNDKRYGNGLYLYANGDIFEGNWNNDRKHDEGKHYFMKTGGTTLTGLWKNGKAVVGILEIGSQRQNALAPIQIPITETELVDSEKIYEEWKLHFRQGGHEENQEREEEYEEKVAEYFLKSNKGDAISAEQGRIARNH